MVNFPVGSVVDLEVGEASVFQTEGNWREFDADAQRPVPMQDFDYFQFPAGIEEFFSLRLRLRLRLDGTITISGVDRRSVPTQRVVGGDTFYDLTEYNFIKEALLSDRVEALQKFTGFPFAATFRRVDRIVPDGQPRLRNPQTGRLLPGTITSWSVGPPPANEFIPVHSNFEPFIYSRREVSVLLGWMGFPVFGDTEVTVLDVTGAQMRWEGMLDSEIAWHEAVDADFQSAVNGISDIEFITMPGRIDSDGTKQPQLPNGWGVGPLPLDSPIVSSTPFRNFVKSRAEVVYSEVVPSFSDLLSEVVVERSRHVLELEIADREAAGLGDTPDQIGASLEPQCRANGKPFFIDRIREGFNKSITLTLVSRRGT